MSEVPSHSILDINNINHLSDLNDLQGQELTSEEGKHLRKLQEDFAINTLKNGFSSMSSLEQGNGPGSTFDGLIHAICKMAEVSRSNDASSESIYRSANELQGYYELIHEKYSDYLDDSEKMFLEYQLGLLYAELNTKLSVQIAKKMPEFDTNNLIQVEDRSFIDGLSVDNQESGFMEGLYTASEVAYQLGDKMQEVFGGRAEDYWIMVAQALKSDPKLEEAAKLIVSMRYIPQESGRSIEGMAQFMHWSGFGGNASIIKEIPELKPLADHAIAWHGGSEKQGHFSKRMSLFADAILPLKAREGKVLGGLINTQFPGSDSIKVLDLGAGPQAKGVWPLAKALSDRYVDVDAADVDGNSVSGLANSQFQSPDDEQVPNLIINKALRVDLNQQWNNPPKDRYEAVVTSIVLHQVMDSERGCDLAGHVLKSMTVATKENGFISWSDAGDHVYIQSMVIPFNVVDREGRVPVNIFEKVAFSDVAVEVEGSDKKMFKIPYRLQHFRHATPQGVAESYGSGLYESNIFQVITVSEDVLNQLDQNRQNTDACDVIMQEWFLEQHNEEVNIILDQRKILDDVLSY